MVKMKKYFWCTLELIAAYPRQIKNNESMNVQPSCIARFILSRIELKLWNHSSVRWTIFVAELDNPKRPTIGKNKNGN